MACKVFVFGWSEPGVEEGQYIFQANFFLHDEVVEPGGMLWSVRFRAPFDVSPVAFENLIEDAIIDFKTTQYPGSDPLARNAIMMFDVKRGQ